MNVTREIHCGRQITGIICRPFEMSVRDYGLYVSGESRFMCKFEISDNSISLIYDRPAPTRREIK